MKIWHLLNICQLKKKINMRFQSADNNLVYTIKTEVVTQFMCDFLIWTMLNKLFKSFFCINCWNIWIILKQTNQIDIPTFSLKL